MKLKDYLNAENLTQNAFAKQLGVSGVAVSRYVAGTRLPSFQRIEKIIKVTNGKVTFEDFKQSGEIK